MAQFMGVIRGNRDAASRLGSKDSGIDGHIKGWRSGVKVKAYHDSDTNRDVFDVYATRGSNGDAHGADSQHIACVYVEDGYLVIEHTGQKRVKFKS